jgi:hypothetical protein
MARKATKSSAKAAPSRSKSNTSGSRRRSSSKSSAAPTAGDAFIKLLQSPLVADLVAVAATAALASLAEKGFSKGSDSKKGAGRAVKAAGKAAAAAVGRRLSTEIDEIKKASKKGGAGAKA